MSLKKLLNLPTLDALFSSKDVRYFNGFSYDDLINAESEIGRTIFGPIPAGHQREFFKHRNNVWIWHEEWTDSLGNPQDITIRYEVNPSGVYKKVAGKNYEKVEGAELDNFRNATKRYLELVKSKLYC